MQHEEQQLLLCPILTNFNSLGVFSAFCYPANLHVGGISKRCVALNTIYSSYTLYKPMLLRNRVSVAVKLLLI